MAAQASFQNGINLLSDSKGALSWLMQGSTWKHGGKLPVGWFLTQWMQAEAAAREGSIGIQRPITTEEGQSYMLGLTLPKSIPNGASLSINWRGQTVASFSSLSAGQSLSIGLDGSGGIDQLQLITNSNLDLGQLNGFGLWRMPSGISHPLAMHTSAKVGQTLVALSLIHI